ncbi:hypothetical protein CDAR_218211 [Caerostris darwini]|uniref:Uncharacterized protein n=1 Tax=Caerostris darwini TaxID=1538125 RepID=A0AAV4R5N8_9ARAC|nr:hypothetical protein CDAR_218211 [Caerostris darwini]
MKSLAPPHSHLTVVPRDIHSGSSPCRWMLPGNRLTNALGLSAGRWPDFPGDAKSEEGHPLTFVGVLGVVRDVLFFFFLSWNGLQEVYCAFIGNWYQVIMVIVGLHILVPHSKVIMDL